MDTSKLLTLCLLSLAGCLLLMSDGASGCMCALHHAQTHYCNAEFAIVARILRKSVRRTQGLDVYKIDIIKSYKMSEKAQRELKHGRIMTASTDSMCGTTFDIGKIYVIAGRGPHISTCGFSKPFSSLTTVERRGFNGFYKKGCDGCKIKTVWGNSQQPRQPKVCTWNPHNACETDFGICVPTTKRGKPTDMCTWRKNRAYQSCALFP